jgi:hypothetical protein
VVFFPEPYAAQLRLDGTAIGAVTSVEKIEKLASASGFGRVAEVSVAQGQEQQSGGGGVSGTSNVRSSRLR